MGSVIAILVSLIVLLPQHCKPFTHSVYTITKIDDYRVLPLVVVLAMPDHRPHAPYVDVPKWERRMIVLFYGICLFRNPLRAVAKTVIF